MVEPNDAWAAGQRRRFTRENAHLWIRPDADRFMRPDAKHFMQPAAYERRIHKSRRDGL